MPAYRFEALDAAGKSSSGLLEADNAKAARAQLRAQALVPLEVTQVGRGQRRRHPAAGSAAASSAPPALAVWTRQLAGLVGSGLPLERALTALGDEAEDDRQRELVAHLKSEVNAGSPFARALAGVAARVRRRVPRRRRRRRAERRARRRARAPGRRPGGAPGAQGQADRRHRLPGDRLADRRRDRRLPRHLRRAAGRLGVHEQQARAARPDGRDAGDQRLPARLGLAAAARPGRRQARRSG